MATRFDDTASASGVCQNNAAAMCRGSARSRGSTCEARPGGGFTTSRGRESRCRSASRRALAAVASPPDASKRQRTFDIDRLADNASLGRIFWGQLKWAAGDS